MKRMKINKNDDLLEKYDIIWDEVSADTKKFDSELVYNKSHGDEVSDFYDKFLRGEDRSGKCDLN